MQYPIGSMYGIFTYIWINFMVNVGKYTIHGSYGILCDFLHFPRRNLQFVRHVPKIIQHVQSFLHVPVLSCLSYLTSFFMLHDCSCDVSICSLDLSVCSCYSSIQYCSFSFIMSIVCVCFRNHPQELTCPLKGTILKGHESSEPTSNVQGIR